MLSRIIVVIFVALSAVFVHAAPLGKRQVGDQQCNIDRLKIVTDLIQAQNTTKTLTIQLGTDPAGIKSIGAVSDGLDNAQSAIIDIVNALVSGQQAPASARQQVADGLNAAATALASINSTDTRITSNLGQLQTQLTAAGQAGDAVLADCK
ncbi:hypothetical protein QCA50_015243 [Cerrena zonata]|uniref:Uncharacterized protein n=1 Tax=Cerrena zonata TaxID=2478898 RepID=A0AAW0FVZ2_9APHY